MRNRLKIFAESLPEDIDAAIILSGKNLKYFTGVTSSGVLVITREKSYLFTDNESLKSQREDMEIVQCTSFSREIRRVVKELSIKTVGADSEKFTLSDFIKYEAIFDGASIVRDNRTAVLIRKVRRFKEPEEIICIKTAQSFAEKAFSDILDFIKPGVTEREIAARLNYIMKVSGSEGEAFTTLVSSGENTGKVHCLPGDRKVKNGDFVMMDYGASYKGYLSDMTRTVAVGNISDEMRKVYDAVYNAQQIGIDMLADGVRCSDVDNAVREYLRREGYEQDFTHSLGHCVGLELHEKPFLSQQFPASHCRFEDVTTVEPGIYMENKFGVRIEDMIYLGREGKINLTHADKNLIIV